MNKLNTQNSWHFKVANGLYDVDFNEHLEVDSDFARSQLGETERFALREARG